MEGDFQTEAGVSSLTELEQQERHERITSKSAMQDTEQLLERYLQKWQDSGKQGETGFERLTRYYDDWDRDAELYKATRGFIVSMKQYLDRRARDLEEVMRVGLTTHLVQVQNALQWGAKDEVQARKNNRRPAKRKARVVKKEEEKRIRKQQPPKKRRREVRQDEPAGQAPMGGAEEGTPAKVLTDVLDLMSEMEEEGKGQKKKKNNNGNKKKRAVPNLAAARKRGAGVRLSRPTPPTAPPPQKQPPATPTAPDFSPPSETVADLPPVMLEPPMADPSLPPPDETFADDGGQKSWWLL